MATAWEGRVAEPGYRFAGAGQTRLGCQGHGARLKEETIQEVYVQRDLSAFTGEVPLNRRVGLLSAPPRYTVAEGGSTSTEVGDPAVLQQLTTIENQDAAQHRTLAECHFESPVDLGSLFYEWTGSERTGAGAAAALGVDWASIAFFFDSAAATLYEVSADLADGTAPAKSGYLTAADAGRRRAGLSLGYTASTLTTQGTWQAFWRKLAAYGRHGLTGRGSDPVGFYPSDIVRDALGRVTGIEEGVIEEATGLIVPHSVYLTETALEQVPADMGRLMGWHWGTWEAQSLFGLLPRFDFRPYPLQATTSAPLSAMGEEFELAERIDDLYNVARVAYTEAGAERTLTRTITVPELEDIDGRRLERTLPIDLGEGDASSAAVFGDFMLLLAQRNARAAGSGTMRGDVELPRGGRKPAYLLRSGLDRLLIADLPDVPDAYRDFAVKRVDTTVGREGVASTVELGRGAELEETLQARLALATEVAAFGR